MVSVAIIGNCQAQALQAIFSMHTNWNVITIPPVHLLEEKDRDSVIEKIRGADAVFSQRVTDSFPVDYVRTSNLKEFSNKVLTWPNIYFDGYFPDIEYVYRPEVGKVVGPMDDYHMRLVHYFHAQGKTVDETSYLYNSEYFISYYPDPIEKSIAELKGREADLDIKISDYLSDAVRHSKLFYTMNHPSNVVLFEMAKMMAQAIGEKFEVPRYHPYSLAKVNIPIYSSIRNHYKIQNVPDESFVGITRFNINIPMEDTQTRVYRDITEVIESFYMFYDSLS